VVGPNRFLRRYVGNTASAGVSAKVEAVYYDAIQRCGVYNGEPKLKLQLHNESHGRVTFTITFNNYSSRKPEHVAVGVRGHETWVLDSCSEADGWYDVTVTVSSDAGWSQRLTGHLETGRSSITG
jgi:phospholipase C